MFDVSKLFSFLMSLITTLTSLVGLATRQEWPATVQDFNNKGNQEIVRVMSFNIRCTNVGRDSWEDRIDIVTETIVKSEADSVGVQEATPEWMETLQETLEKYSFVGVGRDDGANKGEYSAIFYLKDKYNLIDSGTFWLSETPDEVSRGWDAACNRICTWAVLENKTTGQRYVHLNSHFDHIGISARANSVDLILSKADEYTDLPVVFTADMNVKEGSTDYKAMTSGSLKDTKHLAEDTM
ncbi:MAG: endonuclease/exonuclease/phosphatase family protein, partial [Clostridia bacterium]|nr:endonuclease/exonuclease/phosphatase family protein [Clostridia bacterium]